MTRAYKGDYMKIIVLAYADAPGFVRSLKIGVANMMNLSEQR